MPDRKQQKVDVMLKRSKDGEGNLTAELPSADGERMSSGQVDDDYQPRIDDGIYKKC